MIIVDSERIRPLYQTLRKHVKLQRQKPQDATNLHFKTCRAGKRVSLKSR